MVSSMKKKLHFIFRFLKLYPLLCLLLVSGVLLGSAHAAQTLAPELFARAFLWSDALATGNSAAAADADEEAQQAEVQPDVPASEAAFAPEESPSASETADPAADPSAASEIVPDESTPAPEPVADSDDPAAAAAAAAAPVPATEAPSMSETEAAAPEAAPSESTGAFFDDALFIGDSQTDGLRSYAPVGNAEYFCKTGLNIYKVFEKSCTLSSGESVTLDALLSQRKFGKVFIMLGINELGTGTTEYFVSHYADMIARIQAADPDVKIYIQSIFYVSQAKNDSSEFKNDTIRARNQALAALANGTDIFYLEVNTVLSNQTGALLSEYTGDGVHLKAKYYPLWRDYLIGKFGN
jgi:lysophospholipase L1-like esterase